MIYHDKQKADTTIIESIEKMSQFVLTEKKLFNQIRRNTRYYDELQLFTYATRYRVSTERTPEYQYGSGTAFNQIHALKKMLGETIERYSMDSFVPNIIKTCASKALTQPFLDSLQVSPFSQIQLQKSSFRKFRITDKSIFRWTNGTSLQTGESILFPAQLVDFYYDFLPDEPIIMTTTSSGYAAGLTQSDAIYRAILELIERDAFMIHYLHKLPAKQVDIDSIDNKQLHEIQQLYKRYRFELYVFEITSDLDIPVFMAITIDRTGIGPAVEIGLKAGFAKKDTMIAAIEESNLATTWIRKNFKAEKKLPKTIKTIKDRAHFWFSQENISMLDFWIQNKYLSQASIDNTKTDSSLHYLLSLLKKHDMNIFFKDVTHNKMKEAGFSVVKVIIPQIQSVYFDERYPFFGKKRLYDAPVAMGFPLSKTDNDLNKFPHPLG